MTALLPLILASILAVSVPAALAQDATPAVHDSIDVILSENGDIHVTHRIAASPGSPVLLPLLEGGAEQLRAVYADGSPAGYEAEGRSVLLDAADLGVTVRYVLPGAAGGEDGYMKWNVNYTGDINMRFPAGADPVYMDRWPVYLDGKEIACHGCYHDIYYVVNEPRGSGTVVWDDQAFDIEIISLSDITAFTFNQSAKSISLDVEANKFVTARFPTELLGPPYVVYLDGERIFSDSLYSDEETGRLTFRPGHSGTVEIIGATVIPEFSLMIPLVAGAAAVAAMRWRASPR